MQDSPVFLEAAARPRVGLREDTLGRDSNDQKIVEQKSIGMAVVANRRAAALLANTSLPGAAFQNRHTGFRTTFAASQEGIRQFTRAYHPDTHAHGTHIWGHMEYEYGAYTPPSPIARIGNHGLAFPCLV